MQLPDNTATKFDEGKPRYDLVDADAITGLAEVLGFGAKKYAPDNWRKGIEFSRLIRALESHLNAIKRGEYTDPESGLPHIDHLGCNWMFLSWYFKKHPEYNNLWNNPYGKNQH